MTNLNQDIREKLSRLNVFEKIIVVNVAVCLISFIALRLQGSGANLEWLSLSKSFSDVLSKPWTLLTYGFTHYSFIHLFFNMIVLYFFGRSFSNLFKQDISLKVYVLGILSGGVAFVLVYNLLPSGILNTAGPLVGASAGVRAIIIFLCAYLPNKEVPLSPKFGNHQTHRSVPFESHLVAPNARWLLLRLFPARIKAPQKRR